MLAAAILLGLVIGSFLNVVIVRLPAGRSLWRPGSACPACGTPIAWHDNIPLLGFVALRGRCRACRAPISWRYPLIEAVTGALFGAAYVTLGPGGDFVAGAALLAALVAITAIDLEHQIIPDAITLPGILAGVVASLATGRIDWRASLGGIVVGGGLLLLIIVASGGGMGGGDMKLAAMLGAFLGWQVVLLVLLVAVLLGGAVALALLALGWRQRKDPVPFGPFLAAGGVVGLFGGERLVTWYLSGFVGP
jgi:leader peptidase (prepilin peptidase)/N-methyltransferase